jgi:glycosyltransferase involved in cell wall biosynthesis
MMAMTTTTVCLNMIVKNEAPVIRRCLQSVMPYIDSWVIVDTGSTDGTQELIRETLAKLPGELHQRPWIDFAHNRNEAIDLARHHGHYLLFIDADEVLEAEPGFTMPPLVADSYWIRMQYGGMSYVRKQLVRNSGIWRYVGVLHEAITSEGPVFETLLDGIATIPRRDGARARDPLTYQRDALLLEKALLETPSGRNQFYLAQSYRDAGDSELALQHYLKRVQMGGWPEEVWYSLYQAAVMKERLQKPWAEVMEAYLAAYDYQPDRAEPLCRVGMHYQVQKNYPTAHLFFSRAAAISEPHAIRLFVERLWYGWLLRAELAAASHYVGDFQRSIELANELLRDKNTAAAAIDKIIANRRSSIDALEHVAQRPKREPGNIRVIVTFRDPGPELDDCVASLLEQTSGAWEALFIDDGSVHDQHSRIPADDARVSLVRHETPSGAEAYIAAQLKEADPDLIVFALTASERLGGPTVLEQIVNAFADAECKLVYGQFRAGGVLGNAEPASCERDFLERRSALAASGPIACRAASWSESPWRQATWDGTRFLDTIVTIRGAERAPRTSRAVATAETPLISCLMVTLDRLALAKRSIQCFADQTWPNRELVIVTDGQPLFRQSLERFVASLGLSNVRFVDPGRRLPLGALRNLSLTHARGEIVCQWDDDDANHPERLRIQAEFMFAQKARASFLGDHLQWIADQRTLSWIDWSWGGITGMAAIVPGTLMMFRDPRFRYPEEGPYARQGEDSLFLSQLYETVPVTKLDGAGYLHLYEYHGRNTFSREHHLHMANFRKPAPQIFGALAELREAFTYYDIPRPALLVAREGPMFALR